MSAPRPSLSQRLPVNLRQHWRLLTVSLALVLVLAVGFGSAMVRPTITSALSTKEELLENIAGTADFFDNGEHSISISYNETEYQDMVKEYQSSGEKEFIRADITIDGTLIENVGLRLKGNSTLMSLRTDESDSARAGVGGPGGAGGPGGQGTAGGGATDTGGAAGADADDDAAQGAGPGGATGGGLGRAQLSFDEPEGLPWLISFGEYVEGRAYQGNTELSLRPATNGSTTAVNEALALAMTKESGQVTQDYSVASVSVNGGESAARIVVDLPDGQWANDLGNGVLYKADASGSMDYVGDDPTDYENSYRQINAKGTYDLQPVMRLLDFVNNSSDEEFVEKLDDYLDVESFAEYLAMQSLLSNGDAMDGPGNNYYLWYDTDEEKFTVLSWDLNMALSGMGGGMGGMGGGMPGATDSTDGETSATPETENGASAGETPTGPGAGGGQMPTMPGGVGGTMPGGDGTMTEMPEMSSMPGMAENNGDASDSASGESAGTAEDDAQSSLQGLPQGLPEGFPGNGELPEGMEFPGGDGQGGDGGGGSGRGSGILKERFLANSSFAKLYESAYADLYEQLIASGYAQDTLNDIVARATVAGDSGAAPLGETITQKLDQTSATSTAEEASASSMGGGRRAGSAEGTTGERTDSAAGT